MSANRTKEIAMTRASARAVRRTAADLSDQLGPHLSSAKGTLIEDVLPKVKATGAEVLPKVKATAPKVKATGLDLAARAGLMEARKKRHPLRTAAIVAALGVGAYAAWNAWRLPHGSEDWEHADSAAGKVPTTDPADASIPGVPADSTNIAF
ncbi:MAG TPA: hypothetical protein VMZ00_15465 [Sporichthya sp.]|nr:hypothetical protein [Sporichthya sp.]